MKSKTVVAPTKAHTTVCLEVSFCKYYNADGDFFQELKFERSFYYASEKCNQKNKDYDRKD